MAEWKITVMERPNISKYKRSFYFVMAMLGLLASFFLLLHFNFLPDNKERLHRDVFNILRGNAESIISETEHYALLYNEYITSSQKSGSIDKNSAVQVTEKLKSNRLKGTVQWVTKGDEDWETAKNAPYDSIRFCGATYQHFFFARKTSESEALLFTLPIDDFLLQLEKDQQQEFIDKYLLVSKEKVLYKSATLAVGQSLSMDSILKGKDRFSSGTTLMDIDEEQSRIFYYPLTLEGQQFFICGLVKDRKYRSELFRLRDGFIYCMVTILVLLIITQPILKLILMSRHEPVRFTSFLFFVLASFAGITAISLLTVHILMLTGGSIRSERNLQALAGQMERGFGHEVWKSLKILNAADFITKEAVDSGNLATTQQKKLVENQLQNIVQQFSGVETATEIDRLFWIDASGNQVFKAELGMEGVGNLKVGDRSYFQAVMKGKMFRLDGYASGEFAIEALKNRVNGAFRMVVSKKSAWNNHVAAISTCMRTWCDPILPRGYGFCLIDAEGLVHVHDKSSKSLKENLFDRLPDPGKMKEAIQGRMPLFLDDVLLYGRKSDVYFTPLKGMPYYLVTYYKKEFAIPVVLKILVFTIIHIAVVYLIYFFGWWLYFGKRMGRYQLLFAPLHLLGWVIPSSRHGSFYAKGALFILVHVTCILLVMASASEVMYGNSLVFVLVMCSPLHVISGLSLVYSWERRVGDVKMRMMGAFLSNNLQLAVNILVQLGLVAFAIYFLEPGTKEFTWLLLCQVIQWIVIFIPLGSWKKQYRSAYFAYLLLFVITVAAMPPSLLTWFAHNIEIGQHIKKQELYLSQQVSERINSDTGFLRSLPQSMWEDPRRAEAHGFFSPLKFRISTQQNNFPKVPLEKSEPYYYSISRAIATQTYDPQYYPVLPDTIPDRQWQFFHSSDLYYLWYKNLYSAGNNEKEHKALHVQMETGPRFIFFSAGWKGSIIWVYTALIILVLFYTLRYCISSLFLWKYMDASKGRKIVPRLLNRWRESESFDALLNVHLPVYEKDKRERAIMQNVDRNRSFFEFLWENCTDKEKFILFDFAQDGLLNYKNSYEIFQLIDKGILVPHRRKDIFRLFSASFRVFILTKKNSAELAELHRKYNRVSGLGSFRFILVAVAVSFFAFIFFTQNDVFEKILALTAGIVSVLANLSRITGSAAGKTT